MPDVFRDQPRVRWVIACAIGGIVWALYIVRVTFGVGPMHDEQGNQAPAFHYLVGALVVSAFLVVWLVARSSRRPR